VVTKIDYWGNEIRYSTFMDNSIETLRLKFKPRKVSIDGIEISCNKILSKNSYTWQPIGKEGGVLKINHQNGTDVVIK